jgi:DNA-binding MarR family transcriptional regulator
MLTVMWAVEARYDRVMSSETGRPETASIRQTGEQGLATSLGFLAFALSRTQLLLLARHQQALARHGLSERQYTVLRLIGAVEHRSQRDVGKQLYIDRTTVVQIVDELERMGLVRRQRSITDRRVLTIELTPEGTATSASAAESVAAAEREFLAPLSPPEREVLEGALRRLADYHTDLSASGC